MCTTVAPRAKSMRFHREPLEFRVRSSTPSAPPQHAWATGINRAPSRPRTRARARAEEIIGAADPHPLCGSADDQSRRDDREHQHWCGWRPRLCETRYHMAVRDLGPAVTPRRNDHWSPPRGTLNRQEEARQIHRITSDPMPAARPGTAGRNGQHVLSSRAIPIKTAQRRPMRVAERTNPALAITSSHVVAGTWIALDPGFGRCYVFPGYLPAFCRSETRCSNPGSGGCCGRKSQDGDEMRDVTDAGQQAEVVSNSDGLVAAFLGPDPDGILDGDEIFPSPISRSSRPSRWRQYRRHLPRQEPPAPP